VVCPADSRAHDARADYRGVDSERASPLGLLYAVRARGGRVGARRAAGLWEAALGCLDGLRYLRSVSARPARLPCEHGFSRLRPPTWPAFGSVPGCFPGNPESTTRVLMPGERLESTELNGIYFSPTGTYYYRPIADAGPEGIFRTTDQSEVNAPGLAELSPFEPLGWNQEKDILWIRVNQRRQPGGPIAPRDVLYDVGKDAATELGQDIVGWAGGSTVMRQGTDGPAVDAVR
jgi:hypothetical protein